MANVKNYRKQGGAEWVVGGEIDIESGGSLKIAGTQVTATAAELNENDASAVGAASKVKVVNMTASDFSDNSETDSGFVLPATAIVKNVFVNVNTKEDTASTKTIDVGTDSTDGGDADGYLAGVSVAAAALVKGTLLHSGQTLGALLSVDEDNAGTMVPEPDVASGGKKVTVTAGDAGGFTEADFDLIIEYVEVV